MLRLFYFLILIISLQIIQLFLKLMSPEDQASP